MPLITTTPTSANQAAALLNETTTATATNAANNSTQPQSHPLAHLHFHHTHRSSKHVKHIAKSMPVTPVQPKSPNPEMDFLYSSPEHGVAANACHNIYDIYERMPHAYPNFTIGGDSDGLDDEMEAEGEDSSSLAMITPPPPYDTPQLQLPQKDITTTTTTTAAATTKTMTTTTTMKPQPPPRKFLFGNRELFNISPATANTTSSLASAITPTKLSAAAAAMFAAPQMVGLNRKWTNLHRKRRRCNSSSGDSKELDKLVLQSVDWDENEMY